MYGISYVMALGLHADSDSETDRDVPDPKEVVRRAFGG
jgi:hypothetical protein